MARAPFVFPNSPAKACRDWLPVLLWMGVIFAGSGDVLSSAHTTRILGPLLHWLLPALSDQGLTEVLFAIRKSGHVLEYAVLGALLWRAWDPPARGDSRSWNWAQAGWPLALAALFAISDECHQAFVPTRQASPWDVLLDSCGAALGIVAIRILRHNFKRG